MRVDEPVDSKEDAQQLPPQKRHKGHVPEKDLENPPAGAPT